MTVYMAENKNIQTTSYLFHLDGFHNWIASYCHCMTPIYLKREMQEDINDKTLHRKMQKLQFPVTDTHFIIECNVLIS